MTYDSEIIILACIIAYQLFHSIRIAVRIIKLRAVFKDRLVVCSGYIERSQMANKKKIIENLVFDTGDKAAQFLQSAKHPVKISLVGTSGLNKSILRMRDSINGYLVNNFGASVNFSLIRDIIDREVEVRDEEIAQSIPVPLYLGLAGTMIGIIFGLMAMPNLNGDQFASGIAVLVKGVKTAMTTSLAGLICTTVLSAFVYKGAKRKVLTDKNDQISDLQIDLLPELIKAEETGVSGLKASLDRFAREAVQIMDKVSIVVNQTGLNTAMQVDLVSKVEKLDMLKISNTNLELFEKLDKSSAALNHFAGFIGKMDQIAVNLNEFSKRTSDVDLVISQIGSSLTESKALLNFLSSHLTKLEATGNLALKAVDLSDAHFKQAIEKLKTETDKRISSINQSADQHESKLTSIYNNVGKTLDNITSRHLDVFANAYADAVPQFNQLDNLKLLPELLAAMGKLAASVNLLKDNLNNERIVSKIDTLAASLLDYKTTVKPQEAIYYKPGIIKRVFNYLFRRTKSEKRREKR